MNDLARSSVYRDTVRGLHDGLGVEDIAAQGGHSVGVVRECVQAIRKHKLMTPLIRNARRAWKQGRKK